LPTVVASAWFGSTLLLGKNFYRSTISASFPSVTDAQFCEDSYQGIFKNI
jgi:hypothetical protein